jgi:hypothetical protein
LVAFATTALDREAWQRFFGHANVNTDLPGVASMAEDSKAARAAPDRRSWANAALTLVVAILAFLVLQRERLRAPYHPDESAYISQSYYFDLFISGDRDHIAWLDYAAFDIPPVTMNPIQPDRHGAPPTARTRPMSRSRWPKRIDQ